MLDGKDLKSARERLRDEAGAQIRESEYLKLLFPRDIEADVIAYQDALEKFRRDLKDATDATKMRA